MTNDPTSETRKPKRSQIGAIPPRGQPLMARFDNGDPISDLDRHAQLQGDRRFRFLADTMPQLIWGARPDGNVDYYNERFISYTGMRIEQLKDWGWKDAIHPEDLRNCLDRWTRTLATECEYEVEYRIKRASDGAYRWHLGRAFALRNDKNEIIQWVGTCTDIEDQRKARNELERGVVGRTAELTLAREQLQRVLDGATNVSIIAANNAGVITLFNSGAENMLGYASEEVVGNCKPDVFHLESEVTARGLQLTEKTGKQAHGFDVFVQTVHISQSDEREWTYVRKDGSHLTVNLVLTGLRDASGTIIGVLGVGLDVSARKSAEAAVRASDEHFRLIVETVRGYALIMLDAGGRVISWNIGAERMKGYKADEIIGRHFSCFYTPEDLERRHPDEELRIAAEQGRFTEEGWRVRKDGSRFCADVVIAPIHDDTGTLLGFAKVVHDITERKKTEEQFQLAVEAAPSAMIMAAPDGRITLVNAQTEKLFGFDRNELLGRPIEMLLPERFRESHRARLSAFFASPSTRAMGEARDLFGLRKNGSEVPVEIGLNPIGTSQGQFVLASIVDITERKFNEWQAAESTAQLKALNKELEEFAYVASHDLKAPLRVIDNASKWLEEDLQEHLTEETRENLDLLRGRVRRMDKLLDDLLEYARIGRATDNRYGETINGNVLMGDVLALLATSDFTLRVSPSFAGIQVCRMPLQQILMNLIGNAIKHHDKKTGYIDVTVEDDGDTYNFAVKDDGPGIPAQFHDQVFKMFQTLRPRDQVEGSGMGLAIVRKTVEVFDGVLQLQSAEGRGSIFRFTWPKRQQVRKATA